MMRWWLIAVVALTMAPAGHAQEDVPEYPDALDTATVAGDFAPLFPFKVAHGSPDNITNVQTWAGPWAPAGQAGFVKAVNAQFVDSQGPRYFTGTNICFDGCFPDHEKAEQVAADLARFGINLVRLHYVHHRFPKDRKYSSPDSFIEPVQLERFDYLFNQLKQRGIYIYMQLNIARKFGAASGFENADKLPWYNNGIDNIEPRMIALQKKYVRDLLTHVNPYTGLAYKDEPAIAMLELANENSLVSKWYQGELDHLPSPYQELFQGLWNDWLMAKYGSGDALRRAWGCRADPLGDEMIADGQFPKTPANQDNYPAWGLQHDGASQGDWEIVPGDAPRAGSGNVARLTIKKIGNTPNMPQFFRRLGVTAGTQYNISFKIRASRGSDVSVRVSQDHDPWNVVGCRNTFRATEEWQDHAYAFIANMTDPKVRLVFADFSEGVTVEISDVSLRPGGPIGLSEDERLETGTVPLPKPSGPACLHLPGALSDMSDFLYDQETAYFQQMAKVVKDELRAPQPVAGTQLNYGFCYPQGSLDYCDAHSYWCHPSAPGGGSWTNPRLQRFWFVMNLPLVQQPPARSTIAQLAIKRIVNRPYTVSEYDHPYPNLFAAEGNLMLFALAAFQNWNGIMHFAWSHDDDFDPQIITGYFDMKANPVKQVHYPACYAMFTRGDVRRGPGKYRYTLELSERQEREMNAALAQATRYQHSSSLLKPDAALSLAVFAGMDLTDLTGGRPAGLADAKAVSSWSDLPKTMGSPDQQWIRNEFGELYWCFNRETGGYFTVDTPNTKVFTGFVRGRTFEYRGLTLQPGPTRLDWATISLVKADGAPAEEDRLTAGRYLLAASGLMHNTGAVFKAPSANQISTAGGYGGIPGSAPIVCEGIPAVLTFATGATTVRLFALDQAGNRAQEVPVRRSPAGARLEIGPQYGTLWYELVVE